MTNPLQEDKGLIEIHRACIQMHAIWRPTPCHDLGVDGQIEFLEPGTSVSTGSIVAVQSKSGPSFFKDQYNNIVRFYPKEKHRRYWSRLKIPIILVLHNPDENLTIFTNVKSQLAGKGPILVDKNNILNENSRDPILELGEDLVGLTPLEILNKFKFIELYRDNNKKLTGIDFLLACYNKAGKYFEIRMRRVTALFELISDGRGYSISQADYDYILRNVMTIHLKKIAEDFLDEFDDMWYGYELIPDIVSPFTKLGNTVIDFLWTYLDNYLTKESYSHLGIKTCEDVANVIAEYAQNLSDKLDASDRMAIEPR